MSKPKKSKSEAECGEGSSCSTNTGGGIIETCIIHFLMLMHQIQSFHYPTLKFLVNVLKS